MKSNKDRFVTILESHVNCKCDWMVCLLSHLREIRRYRSCVDVGLRDCREGNFDNTYALIIESIYCATGERLPFP